jgi:tyrosine-protein phosphatase non-receptor type 9
MTGSKYSNFDYELSQKILSLLKGSYPARLKKVLIVMAPLWFKAPFKILRLFVREKLRDRVLMITTAQLPAHVPPAALPAELGLFSDICLVVLCPKMLFATFRRTSEARP